MVEDGKGPGEPDTRALRERIAGIPDPNALDQVLPLLYEELRSLAAAYVKDERVGHTLQATALTHEAYLRLRQSSAVAWTSRAHVIAVAARAMRQILVDHARARSAKKRGGDARRVSLELAPGTEELPPLDLLQLDDALEELGRTDPRKLQIVEMLYFGGLGVVEVAEHLAMSRRTVERDWRFARAWLLKRLQHPPV